MFGFVGFVDWFDCFVLGYLEGGGDHCVGWVEEVAIILYSLASLLYIVVSKMKRY